MIALLLEALFVAGAGIALGTIFLTVRRYGPAAIALRQALRDCSQTQEVSVRLTEIGVSRKASILRPDFTRRVSAPAPGSALRAAA